MNKYPLIGGSICAVVLIVLASLTNVVGYQTVQASNQKNMTTKNNEKALFLQTIADMVKNKESHGTKSLGGFITLLLVLLAIGFVATFIFFFG